MKARPPISTQGLGYLIAETNRLMRKEFDRRVRGLGLTRAQWLFIAYLTRQPGCTQSELAESLQSHKITVSRQAERLEKNGWLVRRAHAGDGRAYRLFLTPKAARMRERMAGVGALLREDCLRDLTSTHRATLIKNLSLIKARLQQMDAGTSVGKPHP